MHISGQMSLNLKRQMSFKERNAATNINEANFKDAFQFKEKSKASHDPRE